MYGITTILRCVSAQYVLVFFGGLMANVALPLKLTSRRVVNGHVLSRVLRSLAFRLPSDPILRKLVVRSQPSRTGNAQ